MLDIEKLKYPIDSFSYPKVCTPEIIEDWIQTIANFPADLNETVDGLTLSQLNWKYRPDGWNIKQVIHHLADSHMNSFIRFKLALTEESPTVKPYHEELWAELPDATEDNILVSLMILRGLHNRWSILLRNMSMQDMAKVIVHPEYKAKKILLKQNIGLYAWHCSHHLAHIQQALRYGGDFQ